MQLRKTNYNQHRFSVLCVCVLGSDTKKIQKNQNSKHITKRPPPRIHNGGGGGLAGGRSVGEEPTRWDGVYDT